jgi:hypothetical protein
MKHARIEDGVVAEIIALPDGVALADAFHPDIVARCSPCDDEVAQGWLVDGGGFSSPPAPSVWVPSSVKRH